jgi:hypothetical protein
MPGRTSPGFFFAPVATIRLSFDRVDTPVINLKYFRKIAATNDLFNLVIESVGERP